jgi:hypothetical protein
MRFVTSILCLLLAASLLTLAARRNAPLRELRYQVGVRQADPLINAPPLVTFTTVALGGFRGILADFLWLRAARLQQEGQYFELVQLADWITKLEPRFTSVWAYHAWNMAYNISVLFEAPEDRWRWVQHGVQLLRDEGLVYNPGEPRLLYELGWLFQHKIGANLDQAHGYYKQAWAAEMTELLGGPRPDYGALSAAAPTRADLLAREGMPALIAALTAQQRDPFSPALLAESLRADANPLLHTAAGQQLLDHLRLRRMKDDYKLDPGLMREVEASYGPLDWRLPQAHTLYWAWQSRLVAHDFDALAADRMIFQALVEAFRQGTLFTGERGDQFIPSPTPDLLPRVQAAFADALRRHPDQESIATAYRNFLGEAAVTLVSYNRLPEARVVFDDLHARYPSEATARGFGPFILQAYARGTAELDDREAVAVVEGALFQGLYWQAAGDPARAAGFDRLARLAWESYMAPRRDSPEWTERTGLPPLDEIRAAARQRFSENMGGFR